MLTFTRRQKPDQKQRLAEVRIPVRGYILGLNSEPTRWLGVYLDTDLQFRAYKNISQEKIRRAEDRVRRLGSANEQVPGLIRKIQVVVVKEVAHYGTELW